MSTKKEEDEGITLSEEQAHFARRIGSVDEWLREGGNGDVADLLRDLQVALDAKSQALSGSDLAREMRELADGVERIVGPRAAGQIRRVADRVAALEQQVVTEMALIREASHDHSLSDGAVRAIALGLQEPTADDIEWAKAVSESSCRSKLAQEMHAAMQARIDKLLKTALVTEATLARMRVARDHWETVATDFHNALVGAGNAGGFNPRLCEQAVRLFDVLCAKEGKGHPEDVADIRKQILGAEAALTGVRPLIERIALCAQAVEDASAGQHASIAAAIQELRAISDTLDTKTRGESCS